MNEFFQPEFCLAASVGLIALKLKIHGIKDLLVPLCLFYFYFAFGPIINFLAGAPIYFGTPLEYIPQASLIFLLSIATMIITSFIIAPPKTVVAPTLQFELVTLKPIFFFSMCYAIWIIYATMISPGDLSKIEKISFISPGLHYSYLMIQIYLTSFFFQVKGTSIWKLYIANFIFYLIYSLAVGERDFIFPIMSIMVHHHLLSGNGIKGLLKIIAGLTGLVLLGVGIFFIRDPNQNFLDIYSATLNQGSLLFINTYTLKLLFERVDFFYGSTYINSVLNLLPNWIYKTDFNTLDWFKQNYAAASDSGYGFGLDAEGYMNFSYFGVFLTFLLITLVQRFIIKRINRHPFYLFYSVFFISFTMYSFRNDSLAFLKGSVYAVIFFIMVYFSSKAIKKKLSTF